MGAKLQQEILNSKPWSSKIIEVCLNLGIGFHITWLVLRNYENIRP